MDRRTFVSRVPVAAVLGRTLPLAAIQGCMPRTDTGAGTFGPPGVQLYTVRKEMTTDPDRTLARLAEIGYRDVELAGTYGFPAGDFRQKLDAAGLRAVSSHLGLDVVQAGWDRALDDALVLGQELVVVPSLPGSVRTEEGLARVAEEFDRAGETAQARGLRFGYHNHQWEFEPLGASDAMTLLLDRTSPEAVDWQMDVYWTVDGGADPITWMNRHSGRVTSIHIKDRTATGEMVDVGDGVIDFASIVAAGRTQGLRHGFIEHDSPADAVDSVRRSYEHFTTGVST